MKSSEIQALLSRIADGEDITSEDREAIKSVNIPDEDAIAAKIIARERAKYEKIINKSNSELEDYKAQLEEIKTNQTNQTNQPQDQNQEINNDKINNKIELLMKKIEEKEQLIQQKDQLIQETKKSQILGNLKSKLNLVKDYDQDYVDFKLNKYTSEYELDDIPQFEDDIVKSFVSDHPSLIKADDKAGTGLPPSRRTSNSDKLRLEAIKDMSDDDIVSNLDKIVGAIKGN